MELLTGLTLIRNGNELGYPWKECIMSMCWGCNQVLVNCGYSTDGTSEDLHNLSIPKIDYGYIRWDLSNTGDGRELAIQANKMLPFVHHNWVVYLQADEFIMKEDYWKLQDFLATLPDTVTQVELYRTYFWGSLKKRAPKHEIWLGRVFRKGTHEVGGDGMHLTRKSGEVVRFPIWIYHYSRIGSEEAITKRVRNLDQLFHSEEEVAKFKPFSYTEIPESELVDYDGPHPDGVKEFYGNI